MNLAPDLLTAVSLTHPTRDDQDGTVRDAGYRPPVARRLVFDVSTIMGRSSVGLTGIDRVVLETALAFIASDGDSVTFCRFDRPSGTYQTVSPDTIAQIETTVRAEGSASRDERAVLVPKDIRRSRRTRALLAPSTRLATRKLLQARPHVRLALGHGRRTASEMVAALRALRRDLAGTKRRNEAYCCSEGWKFDTVYCSLGMDFAYNDLDYLGVQRARRGFRVSIMIHDLIPAVAPQFSTIDLTDYFEALFRVCDLFWVISDFTQDDLLRFAQGRGLSTPQLVKVPLGSAVVDTKARPPADAPDPSRSFVLCVGTITYRKNHHLLLDVWQHLMADLGAENTPLLVIAGARGTVSAETLSRLDRDPVLRRVVTHIEGASDAEIAWLYQNCRFTVYPSLYEGWGIPVTESHDFGKVCIASDRTSLPEAGRGLSLHLDPVDRAAWRRHIEMLWFDAAFREQQESRIAQQHRRVTAAATAQTILDSLAPAR